MMWLRKLLQWVIVLSLMPLAAGCATLTSDYCDIEHPIRWDTMQELRETPPGITRQIVEHNEMFEELCL